ncbi:MAG: serine/threonine-protein kinase [Thermoleophilaceae bacterium]
MRRPQATPAPAPEAEPSVRLGPGRAGGPVVLERYRLDRRLGAGGFGVVWRGHDLKLKRDVAVKVVPRGGNDAQRSRTEREALAAARLNHPGIVALYEFGYDDDDLYLVSELVEGATLGELSREGAVSDRDAARIGLALCDALSHAHARGVIHRDVKPANVMVVAEPAAGSGFAKLTDLGIAHVASAEDLTAAGDVVGTLAYMAPEQAEGRPVTAACDVYSLALTLYEAWTGTNPVRAQSPAATARRVGLTLPPLRSLRRDLPPELAEAIDAALDPDPAYRPQPVELRAVLAEVEDGLADEGGLVEPETLERFGLTAVRARTRLVTLMHRAAPDASRAGFMTVHRAAPDASRAGEEWAPAPRRGAALAARGAAGLGAGLLALAAFSGLGPEPSFSPMAAAAVAGLAVVALPRVGWLVAATAVCLWLATEGGQPGTAVVLACALAITPLLLPKAGMLWSAPALAPLLGAVGIAPMFVGLATLAPTPRRRAGLGAAGFAWLALCEVLTERDLLFGAADGTLARARWEGSAVNAVGDAVVPLLSTPALAPALVWAVFALLLPLFARGRWAAADMLVAGAWAVGLVAAHAALGDALSGAGPGLAQGVVVGAALGALVAVTVGLLPSWSHERHHTPRAGRGSRSRTTLSPDR